MRIWPRLTVSSWGVLVGLGGVLVALPSPAFAQQPGNAVEPGNPALPDVPKTHRDLDITASSPGGITAEQVGNRAMATSYNAKAAEQNVAGATARVDAAWTNFLPRVGLVARYTRLSPFTPPTISFGDPNQGSLVATPAPAGTLNPTPTVALGLGGTSFPLVFDQYLLQATIAVPISDVFLRVTQSYSAATRAEEAARYDVMAAKAKSYADGKVAYYTWLRARGAVSVAEQTLADAKAHLKDAENQFTVGNASKVDVLRAQTQVSASELAIARAKSAATTAEAQVRVAIHAKEGERVEPGETLDANLQDGTTNVQTLITEAHSNRAEIKSIDKSAESAKKFATASRNAQYPSLSGFGDVTYANPNQRRFPQTSEWFPTWSLGAQVTWSPNDAFSAGPAAADYEARASALQAQKSVVRDGIELEVTQAHQGVLEADTAIGTTSRQLASALEGYRVATELFKNGRGTGTTLTDAEIALAQARFEHLNARVDARIARVRLAHATGRDVHP